MVSISFYPGLWTQIAVINYWSNNCPAPSETLNGHVSLTDYAVHPESCIEVRPHNCLSIINQLRDYLKFCKQQQNYEEERLILINNLQRKINHVIENFEVSFPRV